MSSTREVNDETSAMIGNPLGDDNSWYTPVRDATIGFASGFGCLLASASAATLIDTPLYLPIVAAANTVGATLTTLLGCTHEDRSNYKASDYIKCGIVGGVAILTAVGTSTVGPAIAVANNVTGLAMIGVGVGSASASMGIASVAGLLAGYGLFKAKQYLQAQQDETYDDTSRPSLVINS